MTRRQFVGALALLGLLPLSSCGQPEMPLLQTTFSALDTVCTVGADAPRESLEEAQALCEELEGLLSRTKPTSDVGRINAAQGVATTVDPRTAELIRLSLGYCEESQGLFDITIGAVSELWDFSAGIVPTKEEVAAALPHVGWQGVSVQDSSVRLADPHARLDLGGIAKGYIADLLVEQLVQGGAHNVFVNLGGNVRVLGTNERGEDWSVGVRDPFDAGGSQVIARVHTRAGSVVTSGLYERSFELDGQRFWHILDPRTGYPAQTDLVSASIYSERSIDGDGYTKPLFMLGHEEALDFVEAHAGLQALLVCEDGETLVSDKSAFELL